MFSIVTLEHRTINPLHVWSHILASVTEKISSQEAVNLCTLSRSWTEKQLPKFSKLSCRLLSSCLAYFRDIDRKW